MVDVWQPDSGVHAETASDLPVVDSADKFTTDNVEDVLAELDDKILQRVEVLGSDCSEIVVDTAVATTIYDKLILADTIPANATLRLKLVGTLLNNTGGVQILQLGLEFGGVTIVPDTVACITVLTNTEERAVGLILDISFKSLILAYAQAIITTSGGVTAAAWNTATHLINSTLEKDMAIDNTGSQLLKVTALVATPAANLNFTKRGAALELLQA